MRGFLTTYVQGFSFEYQDDNQGGRYKTWKSMGCFWAKFYEYPNATTSQKCYEVITHYNKNLHRAKRFLVGKLTFENQGTVEEIMPNYGRFYVYLLEEEKI